LYSVALFYINVCNSNTGLHKFSKVYEPPQNSRHQNGDMQQVPYREPTSIGCHITKLVTQPNW